MCALVLGKWVSIPYHTNPMNTVIIFVVIVVVIAVLVVFVSSSLPICTLCTHRREVNTFIALIPLMQIKKRNTTLTLTLRNPSRFSSFTRFVCLITHLNYNLIVFFKLARRYLGLPLPPPPLLLFGMQTKPVDYPALI